jgi:hypothetical protein
LLGLLGIRRREFQTDLFVGLVTSVLMLAAAVAAAITTGSAAARRYVALTFALVLSGALAFWRRARANRW